MFVWVLAIQKYESFFWNLIFNTNFSLEYKANYVSAYI